MKALLVLLLLVHGWYDGSCCGGRDCHPVPCSEITGDRDSGWHWQGILFTRNMLHVSQDDGCHVCVGTMVHDFETHYGVCIYLPVRT